MHLEQIRHDVYQSLVTEIGSVINGDAVEQVFGEGILEGEMLKHAYYIGTEILKPELEFIQRICRLAIEEEWIDSDLATRSFTDEEYEQFDAACMFRAGDVVYQLFGGKIEAALREFKNSL